MSFLISEILSFSCKIILNSSNFKILIIFSEFDSSPKLLTFFYLYFFFFTFSGPETLCCIFSSIVLLYLIYFSFLLKPSRVFLLHAFLFPCWGSSVEGEGERRRGEHLRQPLGPLPRCHPPSVTSDCPFSTHHTHPDEPSHKD